LNEARNTKHVRIKDVLTNRVCPKILVRTWREANSKLDLFEECADLADLAKNGSILDNYTITLN